MSTAEHYTYRVRYSAEDGEYVATVAELGSLFWLASSPGGALEAAEQHISLNRLASQRLAGV